MEIVRVKNLSKSYGKNKVLDNISFNINQGEIVAVVGPNGTGKTTLLEILMTLRKYETGSISVLGQDISLQKGFDIVRSKLGVVLQEGGMYNFIKLKEALDLFSSFYDVPKKQINDLIEEFDLKPYLNVKYQKLSGGWKQRFLLAIAFLHNPELIFLDEPTTGLDPKATQLVWDRINNCRASNKTIVLSTHSMEEIDKYCSKVIVLNRGKIVADDSPDNIKERLKCDFFTDAYFKLVDKGVNPNENVIK